MKHSKDYGPQFDPEDGTIGELQLVRRYVIASGSPSVIWTPLQGRYTRATAEEAQAYIDGIKASNSPDRYPADLHVAAFWCYPGHFDPCGRCADTTATKS